MYPAANSQFFHRRRRLDPTETLKRNVKRHLDARGWTRRDLARKSGVASTSVDRLLNEKPLHPPAVPDD